MRLWRFERYVSAMAYRLPMLLLVAVCGMSNFARAEEMATTADTITEDGANIKLVSFDYESCGGECQVATLFCGESGAITLDLADVDAKHVAKAIVKDKDQIVVTAGKLTVGYDFLKMQFQEMTGSWWVSAHTQDLKARELAAAIAGAKTVVARVGGQTVTLPVDADVKAWALACK